MYARSPCVPALAVGKRIAVRAHCACASNRSGCSRERSAAPPRAHDRRAPRETRAGRGSRSPRATSSLLAAPPPAPSGRPVVRCTGAVGPRPPDTGSSGLGVMMALPTPTWSDPADTPAPSAPHTHTVAITSHFPTHRGDSRRGCPCRIASVVTPRGGLGCVLVSEPGGCTASCRPAGWPCAPRPSPFKLTELQAFL